MAMNYPIKYIAESSCAFKSMHAGTLSHTHTLSLSDSQRGAWIGGRAENMGKLQNPVAKNPIYTIKIA